MRMKYVILEKARPYTRVRRGKMERVKGYPSKERFPPAALEEATVHQIAKDYVISKEKARKMYRDMFAEEDDSQKTGIETRLAVTRGAIRGSEDPKDYKYFKKQEQKLLEERRKYSPLREHQEWERRMSGKFGRGDPMVVVRKQPEVGDMVRWERKYTGGVEQPKSRMLEVIQIKPNGMILARDISGLDMWIHPSEVEIVKEKEEKPKKTMGPKDYIKFYPVSVLKRFLKRGEITVEEFKSLVKKEAWPKELKKPKKTMADMPGRIPGYSLG